MPVPLFATSLDRHLPAISERLAAVAAGGRYILGPEVEAFEREFADQLGVAHCVGVGNGTDALMIALRAVGVEPGDEVVCPSFTFYASAEAIAAIGAVPVFCDVDPRTMCMTEETVDGLVSARTKAILAVHLFGNVAPLAEIEDFGVPVVADAAQATGARIYNASQATVGKIATYSFFPSKNLPCLGDGGALVTESDELAATARRLRFHGSDDKKTFVDVGYNSRLDELQATVLRLLLPELDGWNAARRAAADMYARAGLGDHVALPEPGESVEHVYHLYVVRSERAAELEAGLGERGIGARRYYSTPLHEQPAMARFAPRARLPGTEEAARTHLALPMGPELTEAQVGEVVAAVADVLA
jgi:dTDP-3-amino-3,4,6-trideoxy-alpha-D-glucose transaminase